jgi:phage major head subunit gpT-like protein
MPVTKSDVPNLLLAGLKTIFFEEYAAGAANSVFEQIATIVPSEKDTETYDWLGSPPVMREFKDERLPKGLSEYDYTLKNKTWEASLRVDRAAIEDDLYGQIRVRVRELAQEARRHQDQLVIELLPGGTTAVCYDGQYFFDDDHSEGDSGTQDNKTNTALTAAYLKTGITTMMKFKDDRGKNMGIIPNTLVVPPDLQWTALELLQSPIQVTAGLPSAASSSGSDYSNVLQGRLKLIISPYLTDTTNWYLLATDRIVKPLILQNRMPATFDALENGSESGFMRDAYLYGVRARYNAGYGLWQAAYCSTGE